VNVIRFANSNRDRIAETQSVDGGQHGNGGGTARSTQPAVFDLWRSMAFAMILPFSQPA
jgi:hypothetical protein